MLVQSCVGEQEATPGLGFLSDNRRVGLDHLPPLPPQDDPPAGMKAVGQHRVGGHLIPTSEF